MNLFQKDVEKRFQDLVNHLDQLNENEKIETINKIRWMIHEKSPFKNEPIDFVEWVKTDSVHANDYNPNTVAPPEMQLLVHSIDHDGYTQPVVGWKDTGETYEVVDGFHRTKVAKSSESVKSRLKGYLPIVSIQNKNTDKNDRVASTIRHNRARGKHKVDSMSEIVIELKNRNWTNQRIAKELGMDEDEILRLCQITGLADLFSDDDFSRAWDIKGSTPEDFEFEAIDDSIVSKDEDVRTVNTSDPKRVFHTFDKWECHKAGFYATTKDGMKQEECERFYADFLSDLARFESALNGVISNWPNSCQHYLTNASMNRIAWLGQASVCYESGIPSKYCGGFNLLSEAQQDAANRLALKYLNIWLSDNGMESVELGEAMTERQSTIY